MKNRYLLSILMAAFLLYFALPHVIFDLQSQQGIFWTSWLAFCFLVILGNFSALLYAPKKERSKQDKVKPISKRVRSN